MGSGSQTYMYIKAHREIVMIKELLVLSMDFSE